MFSSWAIRFSLLFLLGVGQLPCVSWGQSPVTLELQDGEVNVLLGGQPFTSYRTRGLAKPILYPIYGPFQTEMTRNYPMRGGIDNEATDHPHHESLWFTHDDVNGANFWSAHPSKVEAGEGIAHTVQTRLQLQVDTIHTENQWLSANGDIVCTDSRTVRFGGDSEARYIDYTIAIHASHGDVTFADTKEGTMAIRLHPLLRLTANPRDGNHTVTGHAVNSEGHTDRDLWGKRAKWVDYFGTIHDHTLGVAIFDHPSNLRHPTWWHARDYGLVAANPFGVHDFESKPAGTGSHTITNGTSLTQRYRFVFHSGDTTAADITTRFDEFVSH